MIDATIAEALADFQRQFDAIEAETLFDIEADRRMAGDPDGIVSAVVAEARKRLAAMRNERARLLEQRLSLWAAGIDPDTVGMEGFRHGA